MTFWLRILLLLAWGISEGQAATSVVNVCRADKVALTPSVQVLEDPDRHLSTEQVLAMPPERFQPGSDWKRPDYSRSAYWLRLTLKNSTSGNCMHWLTVGEPRLENIQVHVVHATSGQEQRAGSAYPLDMWPMPTRQPLFLLPVASGEQVTVLIRVVSNSLLLINPQLLSERGLLKKRQHVDLVDGIALGIVLLFVPFSLIVARIVRSRLLCVHAGAVLFYILFACITNGYLVFFPGALAHTPLITSIFGTLSFAFFLGYARVLFQVRHLPKAVGWLFSLQLLGYAAGRIWALEVDPLDGTKVMFAFLLGSYLVLPLAFLVGLRKGIKYNPMAWLVVGLFGLQFLVRYVLTLDQLPWQAQDHRYDLSSTLPGIALLFCTLVVEVSLGRVREKRALANLEEQQQAEHRRLENSVALRTKQLHDSLQARTSLMARISHDLRSPLVSIIDYARLLGSEPARMQHYAHGIERNARHQLELIDELLEFSRNEAQQMELSLTAGYVYRFLQQLEEDGRFLASRQSNLFVCRFDDDLPVLLKADFRRLRQVLINLLANASKFTHHGRITLKVTSQAVPDAQYAHLRFSVTDTGIGVDLAELDDVVKPFNRGSNAHGYEGSGLGLAIVSQLLLQMGGQLEVQSQPHRGSCFSFNLALETACEDELDTASEHSGGMAFDGEGKRILLVDDVEQNRDRLYDFLAGYGADVMVAEDGARALALLDEQVVDLVITDQMMPDMDGWALLRCLRKRWPDLPVLLYSSAPPRRPEGFAQALRFDDALLKPASGDQLICCIVALTRQDQPPRRQSLADG